MTHTTDLLERLRVVTADWTVVHITITEVRGGRLTGNTTITDRFDIPDGWYWTANDGVFEGPFDNAKEAEDHADKNGRDLVVDHAAFLAGRPQ